MAEHLAATADLVRSLRANGLRIFEDDGHLRWAATGRFVVTDAIRTQLLARAPQIVAVLRRERQAGRTLSQPSAPSAAPREETPPMPDSIDKAPAPSSPQQDFLAKVAAGLSAVAAEGTRRAAGIVAGAERYRAAYEQKVYAEAAARLLGQQVDTSDVDSAALDLLEKVSALPELQPRTPRLVAPNESAHYEDVAAATKQVEGWARLRIAAARGRVVVYGGSRSTKLIAWLEPRIGRSVEWLDVSHERADATRAINALRGGGIAIAIAIGPQVSIDQRRTLELAARNHNVAFAESTGVSSEAVARALDTLESALAA